MSRTLWRIALASCAASALACASARGPEATGGEAPPPADSSVESDPFQGFNRAMFYVNDQVLDRYLYGPLAHGWIFITPLTVRVHIEQFFDNLNFPGFFVQPLLQGDPKQSGVALARFGINSTVGVVGIFDPADHYLGLQRRPEDMGQTFGVWGIPPGPYLSLPVIAPTTCVRDLAGMPFDWVLNVGDTYFWTWWAPYGETFIRDVNRRALADETLKAARESAFDWYTAARDGYLQRREVLIRNGEAAKTEGPGDELYNIDDGAGSTK